MRWRDEGSFRQVAGSDSRREFLPPAIRPCALAGAGGGRQLFDRADSSNRTGTVIDTAQGLVIVVGLDHMCRLKREGWEAGS